MPLNSPSSPWTRPSRLRLWVGALVLALLFVTTLGQVHRVIHAPGLAAPSVHADVLAPVAAHQTATHAGGQHGHGWLDALFGAHSDAECRLYDQLSGHAVMPGVPLLILPLELPTVQFLGRAGDFVARWAALFDARGPPGAVVTVFS